MAGHVWHTTDPHAEASSHGSRGGHGGNATDPQGQRTRQHATPQEGESSRVKSSADEQSHDFSSHQQEDFQYTTCRPGSCRHFIHIPVHDRVSNAFNSNVTLRNSFRSTPVRPSGVFPGVPETYKSDSTQLPGLPFACVVAASIVCSRRTYVVGRNRPICAFFLPTHSMYVLRVIYSVCSSTLTSLSLDCCV